MLARYRPLLRRAASRGDRAGPAAGRGAEPGPGRSTCCASAWTRSSRWRPSRARTSPWPPRRCGCSPPTTCGWRPQAALTGVAGADDEPGGALSEVTAARKALDAGGRPIEELAEPRPGGWPRPSYLLADWPADLARYLDDLDAEPGRLEQIAERRSALAGLTRKYGSTIDEVLAWAADAAVRLTELRVQRRPDRASWPPGSTSWTPSWPSWPATITAARHAAADDVRRPGGRPSWPRWPCRTPGWPSRSPRPSSGRTGPTRSSCCSAPTRAASRAAWARSPPAASCPGSGWPWRSCWPPAGPAGTLVFDEVDAGVGGRVAVEIGRRLARLARHSQVDRGHPPGPGRGLRRPALRRGQVRRRPGHHQRRSSWSPRRSGPPSWPG